ncbi:DUF6630 family protein [Streptococcus cristatus]|uniref:DUF6630 domain-containing protein n=1 Tax=Streptococcus cristatus TaxID=45634 RepID=A0A3R9KXC1_STRCR|nr:DUF6630 family protein [Streptococcus cristatus]RSJ91155.1 hypothetical protein D8792_03930 [Streptococcus cristatus]
MTNELNKEIFMSMVELLTEDSSVRSAIEACLTSLWDYFDENLERYDDRGIEDDEAEDTIVWLGIVDELIESGDAIELDWNSILEDFTYFMKELADQKNLPLKDDWLDEDRDIPSWCKVLDEKWEEAGYCVGAMDIDSDSYVIFVCRRETLTELTQLGQKVGFRFDFAKNM